MCHSRNVLFTTRPVANAQPIPKRLRNIAGGKAESLDPPRRGNEAERNRGGTPGTTRNSWAARRRCDGSFAAQPTQQIENHHVTRPLFEAGALDCTCRVEWAQTPRINDMTPKPFLLFTALALLSTCATANHTATQNTKPPVVSKFDLTDSGLVTNGYLRMRRPDLLLSRFKAVKAGKATQLSLDTLVSPKLQTRLGALVVPPNSGKPTAPSGGLSTWGQLAANLGVAPQVDYSPAQLSFAPSWDKQTVTCTLHLDSPTDGPISAWLGPKSPFTIKSMVAYDGAVARQATRGGTLLVRKTATETTKAPWTLTVAAGQEVDITLSFSPKFNPGSFPAGLYKDTLIVRDTGLSPGVIPWDLSVPVSGMFNGIQIGVIGLAIDRDSTVVTDPVWQPGVPQTFDVQIELINPGPDANGTLVAQGLPTGLSMKPVNIDVPAGKTVTTTVTFAVDQMTHFYDYLTDGTEVPLGIQFNHGGTSQDITADATFYVGTHMWTWYGNVTSINFEATFSIDKTGMFYAGIAGYNANVFVGFDVTVTGVLNGMQVINMGVSVSRLSNFEDDYHFVRSEFKNNYVQFITSPLHMTVSAN